jgi:hypothetical protein
MTNDQEASYQIAFWSPYTVDFADAQYSIEFKAPQEGNTEKRARNQSITRTRAGNVQVYDRGNNFNTTFKLEFADIPDSERAQLITFLEAIQWGSTKIKYRDMYGSIYVVRILAQEGVEYIDNGLNVKRGKSFIRWNFNLELLNLTDNPGELESVDTVPTSALLLHMQDYDDPHSPATLYAVADADGEVVLDSVLTIDWKSILWTILAVKAGVSATYAIVANNDRVDIETDATAVESVLETLNEQGDATAHITFTVELNGADTAQVMRVKVNVNTDGWRFEIRKIKLGSRANIYE